MPFLFLLYIFAYLDRINVGFAALQMNAALGLSATAFGLGAGVFFFGYTAFEVPSNIVLARVGARRWIARIAVAWGALSAATMFAQGPWSFGVLRFLLGVAEAGFFPGIIYYLTRWVPARDRARTIATFMTATLTAGIVGGPVSGALLSMHGLGGLQGWQWLFLLEGLPAILLGLAAVTVLTESPAEAAWLPEDEKAALVARLRDESAANAHAVRSVMAALGHGRIWLLSLVYFTVPLGTIALGFFLPQIIQASFTGTAFEIGLLSALPYATSVVAMILAGRWSDRSGERRWYVALGAFTCGAGLLATTQVQGIVASMVTLSIAMAGLAAIAGPFWTLAASFVDGTAAAAGIALINSVANIGGFVGPYVLGYLRDRTQGFTAGLVVIGTLIVLCGAAVLAMPPARPGQPGN